MKSTEAKLWKFFRAAGNAASNVAKEGHAQFVKATSATTNLKIFVAGHTSAGKTSWLWSLPLEGAGWNGVRSEKITGDPNSTLWFEGYRFGLEGIGELELSDSPGLNFSVDILEFLKEKYSEWFTSEQFRECIQRNELEEWPLDARIIKKLFEADILIIVIDCRKDEEDFIYKEHKLLCKLGKQHVVVLNHSGKREDGEKRAAEWEERLRSEGAKSFVRFDAFVRAWDSDIRFRSELIQCLNEEDPRRRILEAFLEKLAENREERLRKACVEVVTFVVQLYNKRCSALNVQKNRVKEETARLKDEFKVDFKEKYIGLVGSLPGFFNLDKSIIIAYEEPSLELGVYKKEDLFDKHRKVEEEVTGTPTTSGWRAKIAKPAMLAKRWFPGYKTWEEFKERVDLATESMTPKRKAVVLFWTAGGGAVGAGVDAMAGGLAVGVPTAVGAGGGLTFGLALVGGSALKANYDGKTKELVVRVGETGLDEVLEYIVAFIAQLHTHGGANDRDRIEPAAFKMPKEIQTRLKALRKKYFQGSSRWRPWRKDTGPDSDSPESKFVQELMGLVNDLVGGR